MQAGIRTRSELSPLEVLHAGGVAGSVAWTFVVPADVIVSQMQTASPTPGGKPPGMLATGRTILLTEGLFGGLFRGWTAVMLRAYPCNAVTFLGFELVRRSLPDSI